MLVLGRSCRKIMFSPINQIDFGGILHEPGIDNLVYCWDRKTKV